MYRRFCLHACLCTICMPGACGGRKTASVPLGLKLQTAVSHTWVLKLNLGLLEEQPLLLTTELSHSHVLKKYIIKCTFHHTCRTVTGQLL